MIRDTLDTNADNRLLDIRFDGPALNETSVPIADLANVLLAVQRIVHKAYLYRRERLFKGARLTEQELREVALQIAFRRRGSDLYGLTSFLSDPIAVGTISTLIATGITAVAQYALQTLRDNKENAPDPVYVVSIYREVEQMTRAIDNVGEVQVVELITPHESDVPPVILDRSTKGYVNLIRNDIVYGQRQLITGRISKLDLIKFIVEIEERPGRYVDVQVNEGILELVLRHTSTNKNATFQFYGYPLYRFGVEVDPFGAFKADEAMVLGQ